MHKLIQSKVSIVVPYYKAAKTINKTLDSILCQTYKNYEVFLIDDGSNDCLKDIVSEYIPKFIKKSVRFEIIFNSVNSGPSAVRNLGWSRANGDYVAFLDADDEWHPQKLQICMAILSRQPVPALIHASCVLQDQGTRENFMLGERWIQEFNSVLVPRYMWMIRNQVATPSVIVSRSVSERFDSSYRYCEDHELWIRITLRYGKILALVGPPLTLIGRPTMTTGGQSEKIHRMRWGEIRMYMGICKSNPHLYPMLPLFLFWSLVKHLRLLIMRIC